MYPKFLIALCLTYGTCLSQENQNITFEMANIPGDHNDLFPALYNDGILFVSDRDKTSGFEQLYYSDLKNDPVKIKVKGSKYHTGPVFYDKAKDIVYLTMSGKKESAEGRINLEIYSGKIKGRNIVGLKKLDFNDPNFSFGHAQAVGDNQLLVCTDMFGGYALVMYTLHNGSWKDPIEIISNSNPIINPYVKDENTIIFASQYGEGLGGFDLYKIQKSSDGWSNPINLSEFNSKFDDLGIIYINDREGFITTNRLNDKDHILRFKLVP